MPNLVMLVFTACLASQPGTCDEHRIVLESGISLRQCQVQGEFGLAQWAGDHPALRIRRWPAPRRIRCARVSDPAASQGRAPG
jgi:hypothetical protein